MPIIALNIEEMISNGEAKVTGTASYSGQQYLPKEACNNRNTPRSKFGGPIPKGSNLGLTLKFKRPVLVHGYGLQTADEGLDPMQWQVLSNQVHPKTGEVLDSDIEISEMTEFEKKLPWTLKTYLVKPIYSTEIQLKISKSTNIAREVQIGQFQILTKQDFELKPLHQDDHEKKKKWLRAVSKSP